MARVEPSTGLRPQSSVGSLADNQSPHDLASEEALLGSILLRQDACDDVATIVEANDFFDKSNGMLFGELMGLHNAGQVLDVNVLVDRLKESGKLDNIGDAGRLLQLVDSVPHAAHAKFYAEIVAKKATYRRLITACEQILTKAYRQDAPPKELLGEAEQSIFSIAGDRGDEDVREISQIVIQTLNQIDARMKGEGHEGAIETGYPELDNLLSGMHPSELLILAARPSMGKTALALNIAQHVVVEQRRPVLFVSLEMAGRELAERMLCSMAKVDGHRLRNGTLSKRDLNEVIHQAGVLGECPLLIDDAPNRSVTEIAAAARRADRKFRSRDGGGTEPEAEGGLGLIVIDYLQLIDPDNSRDSRQEQVARIARRLKGLARSLQVPVLCLAQVNRQAEDSREHRPRLSHLRESGAIEQDADVVMFVHREEYYHHGKDAEEHRGKAEVIVAKQRNGPTDIVKLAWIASSMRFEPRAPSRYDDVDALVGDDILE